MLEELAEERKRTVEDVRRTLDLTTGQIRAAFAILGEKDVPSEQLPSKLVAIAQKFKDLVRNDQAFSLSSSSAE